MGLDGLWVGGPPMDPAMAITASLGGNLQVMASDEQDAARLLNPEMIAPLEVVAEEASASFRGLTFDGEHLTIHLRGPMAREPQRATWLAKRLWSPWI